jgi:hypothetical protein
MLPPAQNAASLAPRSKIVAAQDLREKVEQKNSSDSVLRLNPLDGVSRLVLCDSHFIFAWESCSLLLHVACQTRTRSLSSLLGKRLLMNASAPFFPDRLSTSHIGIMRGTVSNASICFYNI